VRKCKRAELSVRSVCVAPLEQHPTSLSCIHVADAVPFFLFPPRSHGFRVLNDQLSLNLDHHQSPCYLFPTSSSTRTRHHPTAISTMFASIWKPLAYVSATALSVLGVISTRSRKARYYLHLTLYLGTMGFCSILGVVYSLALSLVGQVSAMLCKYWM
jgi:hypothetical protein